MTPHEQIERQAFLDREDRELHALISQQHRQEIESAQEDGAAWVVILAALFGAVLAALAYALAYWIGW